MSSRPAQHLINVGKRLPKVNKLIDNVRQAKGKDIPNWPNYCFIPIAGWYAITTQALGKPQLGLADIALMQALAATHTWQFSKGFYQFDTDLYNALINSKISGDLPSEVLFRLPEWCIYIDTPGMLCDGQNVHGFFAHLECNAETGQAEVRLMLDCDEYFVSVPVYLGNWSLTTAIDKFLVEAGRHASELGGDLASSLDNIENIADDIAPFISLLLYLCSDEPDVSNLVAPESKPSRAQPKKTKQGWRLFPANKVRVWDVGASVGEQLRRTQDEYKAHQGGSKRTHLRRGHYKTYWTGARDGDRTAVSRWIPPAIVAGDKDD